MQLLLERRASPIGAMLLVCDESAHIRALDFADFESRMHRILRLHYGDYDLRDAPTPAPITHALDAYFAGDLHAIDDVKVRTRGTEFQRAVWQGLRAIPPGNTASYGKLATTIGHANAIRAVGRANGANPVAIVVPCHRVIGADGTLTGYAGGLRRKQWLLDHEQRNTKERIFFFEKKKQKTFALG
ncbi:MAG TPA: methylated-DNA--[protein]-cysteine S-methyltransferase [Acetobacteraceae bacterium]|nr:methylated-DNA--[protein]-cysteine S-methyltransferase [Acetobacteraceae bacterium]